MPLQLIVLLLKYLIEMTLLAFIGMSLAWSFSWFAMRLQIDSFVPLELSVLYRFVLTSLLMFVLCAIAKQRMTLKKSEIGFFIFIGLTNFCLNFLLGYFIVHFIPSGVLATIFSLSIITTEIISSFIDKRKIETKIIISSLIGIIGLAFFILPTIEFSNHSSTNKTLIGFALSLIMMITYSAGNVAIGKNRKINSTPLYTSIAYGSAIGSVFLLLFSLTRGNQFIFDTSPKYVFSLIYLVVVASVLAFICLFYLIQKIGSTKANYTALIYPALALTTSAYFENFQISFLNILGFVMIVAAIAIEFVPIKKLNIPKL
jgi:drug/metabolite transporter (DMT)-like permease